MTAPAPQPPTLEQLWARGHALLDARREPLADADFADAWADAFGAALAADDAEALAELDALATTLASLAAAPVARAAPPAPRRTPWLALTAGLAAAAATLALTSNLWHTPEADRANDTTPWSHAETAPAAGPNALAEDSSTPAAFDAEAPEALQPAPARTRIAIKSLDRSSLRTTPAPPSMGRATLKALTTTTRHSR